MEILKALLSFAYTVRIEVLKVYQKTLLYNSAFWSLNAYNSYALLPLIKYIFFI